MSLPLLAPYAMLWVVLIRALLVRARVLTPTCSRCGLKLERTRLGERVCACDSQMIDR
jgi:hypothetical protein